MAVKHSKTSLKIDGLDATQVQPSDWNADHLGNPFDPADDAAWSAPTVTGDTGGNAALENLLFALADKGIIIDGTVTGGTTANVSSIPDLLSALANNTITEIVVANGTYSVAPSGNQAATSLWIGADFASRTNPVTVRAETRGGVIFDGGGATYWGGITFGEGAHDQIWDGFVFQDGEPTSTGVVQFGGAPTGAIPPYNITMRFITVTGCTKGPSDFGAAFDFSLTGIGPHDILLEDITIVGGSVLATALDAGVQFFHGINPSNASAHDVTIRRMTISGTGQAAIMFWDDTVYNVTIEDTTITNALRFAIRYEEVSANTVLDNVVSTGSAVQGFYSSLQPSYPGSGSPPSGVTVIACSFA